MTNDDKAELRYQLKNHPERSNQYLADLCECSIGTVRKYRKVFCK